MLYAYKSHDVSSAGHVIAIDPSIALTAMSIKNEDTLEEFLNKIDRDVATILSSTIGYGQQQELRDLINGQGEGYGTYGDDSWVAGIGKSIDQAKARWVDECENLIGLGPVY